MREFLLRICKKRKEKKELSRNKVFVTIPEEKELLRNKVSS